MIYVAAPYSHPKSAVRHERYLRITHYCGRRMMMGELVFSPITYGHGFALLGLADTAHTDWICFNERMMLASEEVRVLQLPGWEKSKGIAHELDFADRHGIRITKVANENI